MSPNELEALKMESDTWALLQALMSYVSLLPRRRTCSQPEPEHRLQTTQNHPTGVPPPARPPRCESIYTTSHTCSIHHALITPPLRSRRCTRMATRLRSCTDDPGCHKRLLEVHPERRLAGQEDSSGWCWAGDRPRPGCCQQRRGGWQGFDARRCGT